MKTLFLSLLAILTVNTQALATRLSDNPNDSHVVRLKPEYKDPVVVEPPREEIKSYEETPVKERFRHMNSFCAGYYASQSLGEMGTVESLGSLVFKNTYSNQQKLAVRLFTEHSNAYKRQGGISQEFYDLGGRLGGQIFMSGQAFESGETFTAKDIESDCADLRKGIMPP